MHLEINTLIVIDSLKKYIATETHLGHLWRKRIIISFKVYLKKFQHMYCQLTIKFQIDD